MHCIELDQVKVDDELPGHGHHQSLISHRTLEARLLQFHLQYNSVSRISVIYEKALAIERATMTTQNNRKF